MFVGVTGISPIHMCRIGSKKTPENIGDKPIPPLMTGILIIELIGMYKPLRNKVDKFIPTIPQQILAPNGMGYLPTCECFF